MNGLWSRRWGSVAALVCIAMLTGVTTSGLPTAGAGPTTDDQGFVDSTARCLPPNKAVAYGYTESSRVAVCKDDASGQYQYRAVRVSDGARLILPARSTDGGFVADNDGITYTVTSTALTIRTGGQVIRAEPMVDFHGQQSPAPSTASSTTTTPPTTTAPPTKTTPLPAPLPAEVGGGG